MALLHQFQLAHGTVTYRSRFLQSSSYLRNSQHSRIVASEFGTLAMPDPCKSLFGRFLSRFEPPRESASVKPEGLLRFPRRNLWLGGKGGVRKSDRLTVSPWFS